MADSVVKLRIDSKEYDANIKRAGEALQQYFNRVRQGGGTLEHLDEGVLEAVKAMGELGTKAESTRGAMRELLQATADLTVQYRGLTDAEKATPLGAAMAESISQMTERAGVMRDAMDDVNASIQHAASDTRGFDQIAGGISLMTSGFQTAVGAANLFGLEIGNQEKVLTTLASAMSITNGLQTVQNLLQSQSALMMGVQAAKAALATAAQTALAAATGSATIAQKAFNVVANANPYVLLATAVTAVATALYAFASGSDEAEKEAEELAKAQEEAKKKADDARNAFVNASAEAMNSASRLSSLQVAYMNANSEMEKTSILKQAQEQFKKLGIECNGVNDAQTLLIKNGAAVLEMIRLQGTVAALSAVRMEAYKKSFKMLMENGYGVSGAAILAGYNGDVMELDEQITQMQGRLQGLKSSLPMAGNRGGTTRTGSKTKASVEVTQSLTELQLLEDELKTVENSMKPFGKATDDWKEMNTYAEELRQRIKEINGETPQLVKGLSINSNTGLSQYISMLQEQLQNEDFGSKLYTTLSAQLADTTTLQNLVGESLKVGLGTALFDVADETGADFWTRAMEGGVKNIDWQAIIDQINEARKAAGLDAISLDFKTGSVSTDGQKKNSYLNRNEEGKMELKMTDAVGGMASGIQNMAGGLEQLGIDIPQGLSDVVSGIQSVTNILSGIMSIVSVIQAIAGADAIIPFAGGGIVPHFAGGGLIGNAALGMTIPGRSYSGDLLRLPVDGGRGMIGVNSGEIIMNQAQAGILESELSGGRMRDINVHGVLQGENIVLAVSNYFRRTGKGEAVMWGKN